MGRPCAAGLTWNSKGRATFHSALQPGAQRGTGRLPRYLNEHMSVPPQLLDEKPGVSHCFFLPGFPPGFEEEQELEGDIQ